jgi:hypothetical protein
MKLRAIVLAFRAFGFWGGLAFLAIYILLLISGRVPQ